MMHLNAALLLLNLTIALPALSAPPDFGRLRKAADTFAEKSHPGAKLWRIDVIASYESGALEILEGAFYYFYEHRSGLDVMKVHALAPQGANSTRVEERNWGDFRSLKNGKRLQYRQTCFPRKKHCAD